MSGLMDDLTTFKQATEERIYACPVRRLVQEIATNDSDEAAKQAKELLEQPHYSASSLCVVFRRNGYKISRGSVGYHRNGECNCESQ